MPDGHYGKGATVGTVLATQGVGIPAAVDVDIDEMMEHARDLVEVKYILKQFVHVKGD